MRTRSRTIELLPPRWGNHWHLYESRKCQQAVEESNSFPLDGGKLGWGWKRQSTPAPPPRPAPTTRGGEMLDSLQNLRNVDTNGATAGMGVGTSIGPHPPTPTLPHNGGREKIFPTDPKVCGCQWTPCPIRLLRGRLPIAKRPAWGVPAESL